MATSAGLAWSLANGISQEQYDKNLVDAYKNAVAQGLTDAQIESSMNQYGISAGDLARATGVTPESVQARLDAATPTTAAEIAYNKAAMDELAVREAANQQQIATNQKTYEEQQYLNELANQQQIATNQKAYEEQQRLNNLASAEQQRLNQLASAEQQRLNQLASQQQIATNQKAYEEYQANQARLAAGQARLAAGQATLPFANATQGFAQNFQNYQSIAPGAQYNPAVMAGGASPYGLIMDQMKPFSNPYANIPANRPLAGYNPGLYDQIAAANLAKTEAAAAAAATDPGQISDGLAKGGMVHGGLMFGMNPPGPDDGAVNLDMGEYVVKKSAVNKYGKGLLDMINEGKVPAKKMKSLLG